VKKRLLFVLLLVFSMIMAACSGGSETSTEEESEGATESKPGVAKNELVIGLDADPPQLDPHMSSAAVDRQVFQSLFNKLIEIDENLEYVPELATD